MEDIGPINVEFLINNPEVAKMSQKVKDDLKGITSAAKDEAGNVESIYNQLGAKGFDGMIEKQREVIKMIESDLADLQNQLNNAAPGLARQTLVKETQAAKRALEEEKAALAELEGQTKKTGGAQQALETRIRMLRDEMAELQLQGKQNSDRYRELAREAGRLTDAYKDSSTQARVLANDYQGLQATISGVSGLTGAFSAAQGVMGLFADENDNLIKIQTRIQSLMGITIGLQETANMLNKDSAFRVVAVARAKQLWSKAVTYLNTQLKLNIGLSKAMVASGIGAIIAAIGLAVAAYQKWSDRQEKINKLKKDFADASKSAAKNVAEEQAKIETMLMVANDYNSNLEVRKKAVDRLNAIMPDLHANLDKEGKLILGNAQALETYITRLMQAQMAQEEMKKLGDAQARLLDIRMQRTLLDEEGVGSELGFWDDILTWTEEGRQNRIFKNKVRLRNELNDQEREAEKEVDAWKKRLKERFKDESLFDSIFNDAESSKATKDLTFSQQLTERKKLYEQYFAWVNAGQADADQVFAALLKGGESFTTYLERQKAQLEALPALTVKQAENLQTLRNALVAESQEKTILEKFSDDLVKMKAESESALEYLDKLQSVRESLNGDQSEMGSRKRSMVAAEDDKTREEIKRFTQELMNQYQTFAARRAEIDKKYNTELKALEAEKENAATDEQRKRAEEAIRMSKDRHEEEKKKINDEQLMQSEAYKRLHNEALNYSKKELKARLEALRMILAMNQEISDELKASLKKLTGETEQILEDETSISKKAEKVASEIYKVADGLAGISNTLRGVNDDLADTLEQTAKVADAAAQGVQGIGRFASGDIVGGTADVIQSIVKFASFNSQVKKMNREARNSINEFYEEAERGELRYQELLRQRERDQVKMGKTTYKGLIAELELLKSQSKEVEDVYNKLFATLQGQEYVAGKGYQHGTWLRKAKTWDVMASLYGSDYARLEELYNRGELGEKAAKDFEDLKKLREELEAAGVDVYELQQQINELLTGTSASGLADGLSQLFANGKLAAQDLGDSFEDIMRTAIQNTFKYKYLEEQMQPFYEALSDMMVSGTPTQANIEALRQQYEQIGQEAIKQFETLEQVTGMQLGGQSP